MSGTFFNGGDSSLDVECLKSGKKYMSLINSNSRFKLLRYRCAAYLLWGTKRKKYKVKYQKQKDLFAQAKKEKWYLLGIHLFSKISLDDFDFYEVLGLPFIVKNCSLPEKRHSNTNCVTALPNNSNTVGLSQKEHKIYSLIRFWASQKVSQKSFSFDEQQFLNCLLSLGYVPEMGDQNEKRADKSFDPQVLKHNFLGFKTKLMSLQQESQENNTNIAVFGTLPPDQSGIANYNNLLFVNSPKYDVFCFDRQYIAYHSSMNGGMNVYPYFLYNEFKTAYKQKIFVLGNSPHNCPYLEMAIAENDKANSWLYLHEARLIDFIFWYFDNRNKSSELGVLLKNCYPEVIPENIPAQILINKLLKHCLKNKIYGLRVIHKLTGISNFIVNNDCARTLVESELQNCNVTIKKAFLPITDLRNTKAYEINGDQSVLYIGSFGLPDDNAKQTRKIIQATIVLNKKYGKTVKLILAGYGVKRYYQSLTSEEKVYVVPFDSPNNEEFYSLMKLVQLGVQLRPNPQGESSGVICQLLGMGKKLITTKGFIDSNLRIYSKEVSSNVRDQELAELISNMLNEGEFDNAELLREYSFDVLKKVLPDLLT